MTALHLAPEPVVLLSKAPLGAEASSLWAQGGIAAAMGEDDDPALHWPIPSPPATGFATRKSRAGSSHAAPAAIEHLARLGVGFDRRPDGGWRLGLEAAHSRRRIVHADRRRHRARDHARADRGGARMSIDHACSKDVEARRLHRRGQRDHGRARGGRSAAHWCSTTGRVVIATGGIGGLFLDSTNPAGCFGQGLALAAHAGAELADLEFVQFHPTALRRAVASDAADQRGHSRRRRDPDRRNRRALHGRPARRRARAARHRGARGLAPPRARPSRFPRRAEASGKGFCAALSRHQRVLQDGRDRSRDQPIPVRPAAHYHMGGIAVDSEGRSTVGGLWACGEVSRTGLHGANRLASNSLMEAVVCARWVAESVRGANAGRCKRSGPSPLSPASDPSIVRPMLSQGLGVLRDRDAIGRAIRSLFRSPLAAARPPIRRWSD